MAKAGHCSISVGPAKAGHHYRLESAGSATVLCKMAEVTPLSPELSRSVSALARALVAAARSWALYPPDHPAVARVGRPPADHARRARRPDRCSPSASLPKRCSSAASAGGRRRPGHRGRGVAPPARHPAAHLRRRRPGRRAPARCSRCWPRTSTAVRAARRARQGVARAGPPRHRDRADRFQPASSRIGRSSIPARRKDDLWRAIVRAVTRSPQGARRSRAAAPARDRRRRRSRSASWRSDVIAPNYTADGSPMLTSQAAAVVAAYRHLVGIVDVMAPERRTEVMQNLAAATATLDPRVDHADARRRRTKEARAPAGGATSAEIRGGIAAGLRRLQGRAAARDHARDRRPGVAIGSPTVFDTIAPDEPRKRRVLTLTRTLLSETVLRQDEPVPDAVDLDGRAAAHLQREAVRLAPSTRPGSTRSARAPTRWRPTFPRSSSRSSRRSDRTTSGGCR